jgi:hypothetical protein
VGKDPTTTQSVRTPILEPPSAMTSNGFSAIIHYIKSHELLCIVGIENSYNQVSSNNGRVRPLHFGLRYVELLEHLALISDARM